MIWYDTRGDEMRDEDQNLKRVAEGFSKEFLICREQIKEKDKREN